MCKDNKKWLNVGGKLKYGLMLIEYFGNPDLGKEQKNTNIKHE